MVNFFKDEQASNVEDKFDLEMQELSEFSMYSPATLAAKNRKDSLATSETDGKVERVTSSPISSPKFPAPPVFLTASSGDQIKLMRAGNAKLRILIVVATLAIVVSVVFGIWNVSIHYGKKATQTPEDPACVGLEAKLELSLQALTRLRESLTNLTRLAQESLTNNPDTRADSSWSSHPKFTWA